jgi:hypothetical protein
MSRSPEKAVTYGNLPNIRIPASEKCRNEERLSLLKQAEKQKAAHLRGRLFGETRIADYLILVSLYGTCLRAFGSNLMISILPGMVRLFLVVV